ncbi:MAG: response regulator [Bacteroidetes bacterium]|nr:response regulator [Bacteroidota bacterium]MCW5896208.1 response regulator [Bacteroidota bacterium]
MNLKLTIYTSPRVAMFLCLIASRAMGVNQPLFEDWRVVEFTTLSGLPSNHIHIITETEDGTPWVVTSGGLAWFDGYRWIPVPFHVMPEATRPILIGPTGSGSLAVIVNSILYVGNQTGFYPLPMDNVRAAVQLDSDSLIVLCDSSLYVYHVNRLYAEPASQASDIKGVYELVRTRGGSVWIKTTMGLYRLEGGQWIKKLHSIPNDYPLNCSVIAENEAGSGLLSIVFPFSMRGIWEWNNDGPLLMNTSEKGENVRTADIANDGAKILVYESGYISFLESGRWSQLEFEKPSPRRVGMVRFRKNGDLWLCSDGGLFLFKRSSQRWRIFGHEQPTPRNYINDILLAKDSTLWVATGNGVEVHERNGTIRHIEYINGFPLYVVTGLMQEESGPIWISSGSAFDGAFRWDGKRWQRFAAGTPLAGCRIHRIRKDRKGRLWFLAISGTKEHPDPRNPGAYVYDNGSFGRYSKESGLLSGYVYTFDEGPDGAFWFGTLDGLSRLRNGTWTHWTLRNGLHESRIFSLAVDRGNQVWFADRESGLGFVDTNDNVHYIGVKEGLPSGKVWEVKLDPEGRVWCTTPAGLGVMHNGTWSTIDRHLGLASEHLWPVLPLKNRVYIGSRKGLAILDLSQISTIRTRLFAEEPLVSNRSVLLRWTTSSFWGEIPSERIRTRYRINDGRWSPWSVYEDVMLSNVEPGTYAYEVQSVGLLGEITPHGITGTFRVAVPWYLHPLFVFPVGTLVLAFLSLSGYVFIRRKQQARLTEELRREHEHAQKLAELETMKSRFFANISHEFRTPLTLILGPLDQLRTGHFTEEKARHIADMAHRNAQKLLGLINQLLDLSKLEAGGMTLNASRGDLVHFLRGLVMAYQSMAENGNIHLGFVSEPEHVDMYFDKEKLETVFNNLLLNSFKVTSDGGKITVSVHLCSDIRFGFPSDQGSVEVVVRDTGIGISEENLSYIFNRFYQIHHPGVQASGGTGIGLALAKELVELHHGNIGVTSSVGKGTEFVVSLPLGRSHLKAEEIVEPAEISHHPEAVEPRVGSCHEALEHAHDLGKTIVLIVEDNADARQYIKENLPPAFHVVEAADGEEGVEKAREAIPDLIISDIMMPKKDGYEMCTILKNDEKTSHIPVILLTAKAGQQDKIDGLETGADDFIIKPFDAKELQVRVKNLIEIRRRLRDRFSKTIPLKPGEIAVTSLDDAFLKRVMQVVEEKMSDDKFSLEDFSRNVGMSRAQLHRKLTALTNHSPGEFVRYLRLHRAMEKLKCGAGSVSEIAYSVGFATPAYFAKCFHEQFGVSPSEVRRDSG